MEEKLRNCKQRYAAHLPAEIMQVTATQIAAHLLVAKSWWSVIEERNEQCLYSVLGLLPEYEHYRHRIADIPEEDKAVLWRYADFFLDCVKESTK